MADELRKTLENKIRALMPDQVYVATVKAVDDQVLSCTVKTIDEEILFEDVRLMPGLGVAASAIVVLPKVGSLVLVGIINNMPGADYIITCQEADKIILRGGVSGGLVKVEDITSRLNNIEKDINKIKKAFNTWTVVANDGGAALKAVASSWAGYDLTETKRDDIENKEVTHG